MFNSPPKMKSKFAFRQNLPPKLNSSFYQRINKENRSNFKDSHVKDARANAYRGVAHRALRFWSCWRIAARALIRNSSSILLLSILCSYKVSLEPVFQLCLDLQRANTCYVIECCASKKRVQKPLLM